MRNNFSEIYFLAIDREVLAEHQIERKNVKRSGANGEKQIRGPVEARNFFAAPRRRFIGQSSATGGTQRFLCFPAWVTNRFSLFGVSPVKAPRLRPQQRYRLRQPRGAG